MIERRVDTGDVALVADDHGPSSPTAVVVVHGFAGSAATVTELVAPLVGRHRVVVPDLVGHGRSDAPDAVDLYSMAACVDQLDVMCTALGVERVAVVGYSMGGRVALHWALRHPDRVSSLVTIGATPGPATEEQRAERVDADRALADRIERDGLVWFDRHWSALAIFATQAVRVSSARRAQLADVRIGQRAVGLANSLRGMGTGAMPHLTSGALGLVSARALVTAGADDHKFVAIGRQLAADLPHGRFEPVPEAGHAAHLEQPGTVGRLVRDELG